jgi:uncharacterized membrane protein YedE/YeeE
MYEFHLPIIGGMLIGGASVTMLYLLGRITGISNIFWSAITLEAENAWRWFFIAGLLIGPAIVHFGFGMPLPPASQSGWGAAIAGGLLVGFGTALGSGCTSGHGVCGIGRLSPRSIVATLTFIFFGVATVFVTRHLWSLGGGL